MSKLSDALLALAKNGVLNGMQRTDIADELVALAAQAQELERDAARYRWLRREVSNGHQSSKADVYIRSFAETWESALQILSEDQFDAAIDAAIAKESHE